MTGNNLFLFVFENLSILFFPAIYISSFDCFRVVHFATVDCRLSSSSSSSCHFLLVFRTVPDFVFFLLPSASSPPFSIFNYEAFSFSVGFQRFHIIHQSTFCVCVYGPPTSRFLGFSFSSFLSVTLRLFFFLIYFLTSLSERNIRRYVFIVFSVTISRYSASF